MDLMWTPPPTTRQVHVTPLYGEKVYFEEPFSKYKSDVEQLYCYQPKLVQYGLSAFLRGWGSKLAAHGAEKIGITVHSHPMDHQPS